MREISIQEIKEICSSPDGMRNKKKVSNFVRSNPGFNPERRRPRDPVEAKILNGFTKKNE